MNTQDIPLMERITKITANGSVGEKIVGGGKAITIMKVNNQ